MAIMVPPRPPPPGPGFRAEGLLYEALRSQLDDAFFVYNRLKFAEPGRAREGEADFLVLHPQLGMLVLECKGGGVRRTGSGEWIRMVDGVEEPLEESPFEQAQRVIKTLRKQIEPKLKSMFPRLRGFPFVHGHAVAFPLALADEANLPLDVPGEILWDASDLPCIAERVEQALAYWKRAAGKSTEQLEPWELKKFRKKILHPRLNVVDCLGASVMADEQAMVQLSDEQVRAVDMWLDNPRLRVKGGAGTGKTVLALEAARRLAEQGENVLLLCFNRLLKDYLRTRIDLMELENGKVRAANFHGLCFKAHWELKGEAPTVPDQRAEEQRYWKEVAPYSLLDGIAEGKIEKPSALVVDEGQDFAELWWEVLEELVGGKEQGRMLVFFDPSQNIFGDPSCVPQMPTLTLRRNFRNTRRITEVVCELGQVDLAPHERCPEGEPPDIRKQESDRRALAQVVNLLKRLVNEDRLLPDQITILTPHTRENSLLKGLREIGGVKLATDPMDRAGAVLHTTIGAFKGLESDVVILADVDPKDPRCSRNARYVAASRARHRLFVFSRGEWMEG